MSIRVVDLTDVQDTLQGSISVPFELTSYADGATIQLASGRSEEIGGQIYRVVSGDTTITDSGIAEGEAYVHILDNGDGTADAYLDTHEGAWDANKGGFYYGITGAKVIFGMKKTATNYVNRYRIGKPEQTVTSYFPIPNSNYEFIGSSVYLLIERALISTSRVYPSSAVVKDKLYVIGGDDNAANILDDNEEYDPITDTWSSKAVMTTPRTQATASAVGNKIYVIGGKKVFGGAATNENEEYDPATNGWTSKTVLTTARYNLASAVVNNKIYVIGGEAGAGALDTNQEYTPAGDSWANKTVMTQARTSNTCIAYNSEIYSLCGINAGAAYTASIYKYSPSGDSWSAPGSKGTTTARARHASVLLGNLITNIGGFNGANALTIVDQYDPVTTLWKSYDALPISKYGMGIGEIAGGIYVAGGYDGAAAALADETEEFRFVHIYKIIEA